MSASGSEAESCEAVLTAYVVPPEVAFKEWYVSTANAAGSLYWMRRRNVPGVGLLTGSRVEALSVPEALVLGDGGRGISALIQPDFDSMFPLSNRFRSASGVVGDLVALEPVAAATAGAPGDPRYYKLVPHELVRDALRRRHPSFSGDYLPCKYFTEAAEESSATKTVGVHGPAVQVTDFAEPGGLTIRDADLVDAIRLEAWPDAVAAAWLGRARPAGWPDARLARSLLDAPCFLTPTGRPGSADAPLEWRLSFSLPERRLALSLTAAQRSVYVVVKLLMKQPAAAAAAAGIGGGDGGGAGGDASFRTFYLKNIIFWMCETEPADLWRRPHGLGAAVRAFLERIERCATSGQLPSYFAPASNLLEHEPSAGLAAVAARARQLREGALGVLRLVTARYVFVSLGRVDYGLVWDWFDATAATASAATAVATADDGSASSQQPKQSLLAQPALDGVGSGRSTGGGRLSALLLAVFATLLRQVATSLSENGDRWSPVQIMYGTVRSVVGRLTVDVHCHMRSNDFACLGDRYSLSVELQSFRRFFRSVMKEYEVVDEDMLLQAEALLKLRLRGQHELCSGSFVPVTERSLLLMTAQCAANMPAVGRGISEGLKQASA